MGDDPIARLRAEMDQSREGLRELAGNLWAFYKALRDEGFDQAEAFALVMTMVQEGMRGTAGGEEE